MLLNLDVRDFELSRAPILVHCFDRPGLVLTNCDETAWLASRLPHSPATLQITGSSVTARFSLSECDCFRTLWSQNPVQSYNVLYAQKTCLCFVKSKV